MLKDLLKILDPIVKQILPEKRSGYSNAIFVLYQTLVQITGISPKNVEQWMNQACIDANISFQRFEAKEFVNQKHRRFFPDQPGLSRCLRMIADFKNTEDFWNSVLLSHLILLKKLNWIKSNIKLIADYTTDPCRKNVDDPYCFGTKEGKTVHKTLTFSIIAGNFHQIIANYKIQKYQDKLPFFSNILSNLQNGGFSVIYTLLDRGFYRARILELLKSRGITVIMPGRQCAQTKAKIHHYLTKKGSRYCKGFMKLKYTKKVGYPKLQFGLLLCAKRSFHLNEIKKDFKAGKINLHEATRHIFPLLVLFGTSKGITTLHGNETYIRFLYRCRWWIEIAFREMNRLGITDRVQCRDVRLGIRGAKSLLYNFWQVQRVRTKIIDPASPSLELDEFAGRTVSSRYIPYIAV